MSDSPRSNFRNALTLTIPATILAAALALGLNQVGSGFASRNDSGISVTGSARVSAISDNAVWTLNVNAVSPTLSAAVKSVNEDVVSLQKYLLDGGVPSEAITLAHFLPMQTKSGLMGRQRDESPAIAEIDQ